MIEKVPEEKKAITEEEMWGVCEPDNGPGTIGHVLANLDKIYEQRSIRSDTDSWIICILIDQLRIARIKIK